MECEIELRAGDYRLVLTPERGGSIARFDWRGEPLMRPTCGPSILDTACFPLVPFSNRIALGQFVAGGREIRLSPNFPGSDHPHTIHGFGWLAPWAVVSNTPTHALLRHEYAGGEWPWSYVAEQTFMLSAVGFEHRLSVQNLGDTPMPAGLGFHPYFPRTDQTVYRGLHKGEWTTASDGLPLSLDIRDGAIDWWGGRPVASRNVDNAYIERQGALVIDWPEQARRVTLKPSPNLPVTIVYSPPKSSFFCVEPVSHVTDAINRGCGGLCWLEPEDAMQVAVQYEAQSLDLALTLSMRQRWTPANPSRSSTAA